MNANFYRAPPQPFFDERLGEPCLLIPDGPVIHYDQLDAASARVAHALVHAGCVPGDRVAAQVDKCWEALALYLACLRAGFVYLPLNTGYQKSELAYFFGDAEPRVIVCRPDAADAVTAIRPRKHGADARPGNGIAAGARGGQARRFFTVESKPDDLAAIVYTSGTTGRSKGAMLTHRNLGSNALALVEHWGFTRGDVLLHALPIYHIHGLFVAIHCALLSGCRMLWLAKFDPAEVRSLLPRATVMMGVPTFYTRLLADPEFGAADAQSMRLFISGSAPLLPDTFDEFRRRTGHTILERYGMSETGMNTSNPLDGERIAGTVGPPLPGVSVRIAGDSDGTGVGGIEVKGPNVFAGYWRMPEKTREEFTADGYFRTGDMGEILAEWLPADRRPREGPRHHRRPQRLSQGSRGEDRCAARRRRIRGDRRARRGLRRGGHGGRCRAARPRTARSRPDRGAQIRDRELQGAEARALRRRAAAQRNGQGAEELVAGALCRWRFVIVAKPCVANLV